LPTGHNDVAGTLRPVDRASYPRGEAPRALSSPSEVRLWWCSTLATDDALPVLRSWLSSDECARARRFALPAVARRYVAGRAALRHVLGTLLGQAPHEVAIVRGVRGRPQLAGVGGLDFNVSNTRGVALIGVVTHPGTRIGVDVEHRERVLRHEGLARKFCTPAEFAALDLLEGDARRQRFLRLWTCKEAMSKATGDALAAPLRRLDVAVEPELRLAGGPPPYAPEDWTLLAGAVPDDYIATVALWRAPSAGAARLTR
jgi:4'-phosphopantetheinyl transferase